MGLRPADSPHHRWKNSQWGLMNWKFMTVILIYCDLIDSKLNMGTETNYCGIGQARVHYGVCPGSDDEVGNKTEVFDSALDKGRIDINLVEVINLRDIGNKTIQRDLALVLDEHSNEEKSDNDIGPNPKPMLGGSHGEQDGDVHHPVVVCKVPHSATIVLLLILGKTSLKVTEPNYFFPN